MQRFAQHGLKVKLDGRVPGIRLFDWRHHKARGGDPMCLRVRRRAPRLGLAEQSSLRHLMRRDRLIFGCAGILRKGSQHVLPANAQLAKHRFVTSGEISGAESPATELRPGPIYFNELPEGRTIREALSRAELRSLHLSL